MKKTTTAEKERAALAAIVDSAINHPADTLPPNLAALVAAAPDAFTDGALGNIALAINRTIAEKLPPDVVNVGRRLQGEEIILLSQLLADALPIQLAETEAAPLLREVEARRTAAVLDEAREELRRNPDKANAVARSVSAALAYQSPEAPAETGRRQWPRPLNEDAYIGMAGDFVRAVEAHTEADAAAILFQFIACFGNAVGTAPFYQQEWTRHHAREFVLIVGKSAKARKGTSWNIVRAVFKLADERWTKRIVSGLGSGEGVVHQVRDPREDTDEHGNRVTTTGAEDKRCMVVESEFASILSVSSRDGNTLSEVIRNAWDSGDIQTLTKNNPTRATGAHISIIGHITETELNAKLGDNAIANGFGNRFLIVCAKRSKLLPHGGSLSDDDFEMLARKVAGAIDTARKISRVMQSKEARNFWGDVYPVLSSESRTGNFGSITSRAEAHVLRLSVFYALMDGQSEIQLCHLKAALECWRYCQDSALYIWGDFTTGGLAAKIRAALTEAGQSGLTRSQLHDALGGRMSPDEFSPELEKLISAGEVTETRKPTKGKPVTIYRLRC